MNPEAPHPSASADSAPGALQSWIAQRRDDEPATAPAPARKRLPAWLYVVALILPGAVLAWTWGRATRPAPPAPPAAVHGLVVNAEGRPLPGALVFAVSQPRTVARTTTGGRFDLPPLSVGRQTLIVVHNDIGQEFTVRVAPGDSFDVGTLHYVAPPDR